ncbi:MAG: hypothetical protein AAF456_20280, partial [Planctomycetota bacterium]
MTYVNRTGEVVEQFEQAAPSIPPTPARYVLSLGPDETWTDGPTRVSPIEWRLRSGVGEVAQERVRLSDGQDAIALVRVGGAPVGPWHEQGILEDGDHTLDAGQFVDSFEFEGREGERVTFDLRSFEFSPRLIVISPDGEEVVTVDDQKNFDQENNARALVPLTLTTSGVYKVLVTSREPGETGSYDLRITRDARKIHFIVCAQNGTADSAFNSLVDCSLIGFTDPAAGLFSRVGDQFKASETIIERADCTAENILASVDNLETRPGDAIFFYYIG